MVRDKILIADDETDIALILKLQLEDVGYSTCRVKDGVEVLEALAREQFELLLLDIKMPRMDGMQVLKRVREAYPSMVVVMMTAHGSEDIAVQAMKEGALDYISKPFSNDDMIKRVERAISYNRTLLDNLRLQEQLAAERKLMETILEGMAELLIAVNAEGKVMSVNRMAETLLGRKRSDMLGMPVESVLDADLPAGERLPSRNALLNGEPFLDVTYNLNTTSGKIPVLASATPLRDHAGVLVGSVEIIRDITSLKALEREREDFVSMLSHDLKNPITAIVGSLDLVREGRLGPVNDDQREFIESAEESCTEMVEMINSLLDIHKFEAGKMVMNFSMEQPVLLLEKIAGQFMPAARKQEVELHFEVANELPDCCLDRTTFLRMVGNLLSNALKFTGEHGRITVTAGVTRTPEEELGHLPANLYSASALSKSGDHLKITVSDTGVGIPAEALGAIFDRFVQAQNRRMGKAKGTGLGLAFCRKVMDAHNGLIWAESEEGNGSRFTMLIPLVRHGESG